MRMKHQNHINMLKYKRGKNSESLELLWKLYRASGPVHKEPGIPLATLGEFIVEICQRELSELVKLR